jgi:hypothetical protein
MSSEWTAILVPADGGFAAYAAEFPRLRVRGKTQEEALAKLTRKLRDRLVRTRMRSFRRMDAARAAAEPLSVELPSLAESLQAARAPDDSDSASQPDLLQALVEAGILDEATAAAEVDEDGDPVAIEGRPISEEIIEGRR